MRLTDNKVLGDMVLAGCKKLLPMRLYDGFIYNDKSNPLYELSCDLFYYYYPMDAEKDMVQCEYTMTIYDIKGITCEMRDIIENFGKYIRDKDESLCILRELCYEYVNLHSLSIDIQHIRNLTFTDCKKKITVRL